MNLYLCSAFMSQITLKNCFGKISWWEISLKNKNLTWFGFLTVILKWNNRFSVVLLILIVLSWFIPDKSIIDKINVVRYVGFKANKTLGPTGLPLCINGSQKYLTALSVEVYLSVNFPRYTPHVAGEATDLSNMIDILLSTPQNPGIMHSNYSLPPVLPPKIQSFSW